MPRLTTPTMDSHIDGATQNVWLAVDITPVGYLSAIRACEIEAEVTSLNLLGTSVAVSAVTYPGILKTNPVTKFSRGRAPNGGSFALTDLDHSLGIIVSQIERTLENARIVVSTLWEKSDGTFEADIYFVGYVRDVKAEDTETTFNIIADTDSRTSFVANRALTQRCLAVYGDDRCRRPAELIAPGETCSNVFDDAENGCLAKRWQFAFWGVPILVLQSDLTTNGGWGSGTSSSSNPGGCVTLDSYVLVLKDVNQTQAIPTRFLTEGMILVDAQNRGAVIEKLEILRGEEVYRVECENGARLKCTATHPVIRNIFDDKGTALAKLRVGDLIHTFSKLSKRARQSKIVSVAYVGREDVLKISLANESASLYLAGSDSVLFIESHNFKPITILT